MSKTLVAQAVPMLFAAFIAAAKGASHIADENNERIISLARQHGADPQELRRMATDQLAFEIGGE